MKNSMFRNTWSALALVGICSVANYSWAATINSSSCSQSNVSSAISLATIGDTVQVPAGSCSWSGLSISKAVHLKGSGVGQTNITLTGNNTITKQTNGIIRVSNFSFSKSGGGNESKGFTITGQWKNSEPVIIQNNSFTISNTGLFRLSVAGGVIIAGNSFTGDWDDSFIQPKDSNDKDNSWGTADTMGAKDSTGKLNHYIENNTFYGGTNQGIDCDDSTRCVYRYNTLTYSSFNTHGKATSPYGVRHFEVYNNTFKHNGGTSQIANQNWAIWIRGATGVIFNNQIDDIAGSYWGNKAELNLSIRGAEDVRPQGSCGNVSYPVPHQLGQNHNGTTYFTDPIYIWGNTGALGIGAGWNWGNPCGLNFSTFFQWGRDAVNTGVPKPGYTPFTYPHPLTQGASTAVTYYVDSTAGNDANSGTDPSNPWKNSPGMTSFTGSTILKPGDTVYFDRDDTWVVSGSPQGLFLVGGVRYIGDEWEADSGSSGYRATIRAGNDFNDNGVVRFRDHATLQTLFKGFEVDVNSKSANGIDINHGSWILMNGATKRVENVEVHHVFTEQSRGEYKYGIAMSNWGGNNGILENVEIINCSVHDIGRDTIVLYPSDDPNSRIGNILIRGCEVYNTGQDPGYGEGHGIVVKGWVYNSTIENNYVHNVNSSAIFVSGPEDNGNQRSADNVHIRNNILTTQDNNGVIRFYNKGAKDVKIYGNLIFDNNVTGGFNLGGNSGTLNVLVYNNTFYNTFVDLGSHSSNVNSFEFKNNIIQYTSNQLRNSGAIQSQSNNLLTSSNPGFVNPNNKPTGFIGTYGVNLRPNTDGFALNSGGSAVDGGTPLANAYSGSINSVVRPTGFAWDIGAYEFNLEESVTLSPPTNLRIIPNPS